MLQSLRHASGNFSHFTKLSGQFLSDEKISPLESEIDVPPLIDCKQMICGTKFLNSLK